MDANEHVTKKTLPRPFYNAREVCELFEISSMTLWRWRERDADFPRGVTFGGGRKLYFAKDAVDSYLASRLSGATS